MNFFSFTRKKSLTNPKEDGILYFNKSNETQKRKGDEMSKITKQKTFTSVELNMMSHKGVAAGMVLQSCFAQRIVKMKKRSIPVRKMKHKNLAFGD